MSDDIGMAVPGEVSGFRSSDLLGKLICLRPTEFDVTIETSIGPSVAVRAECLIVNEYDPKEAPYENAGEVLIFWSVVRRQLHEAAPWMVGRVRKAEKGNAYRFYPPEGAEMEACRLVLMRHRDNPIPYTGVQESLDAEGDAF